MYKALLTVFLSFIILFAQAQNKAIIKGKVIDSLNNEPMELATVSVLDVKDTSAHLVAYTVSDKKGVFTLHNLPAGVPLKVLITFVSYKSFRKLVTFNKGETLDLGSIMMSPKQLNEINITGERPPIVIKKDTIEFNAEAFKVRPNAVVEELLKKLPGVEVDNQGNIMVNGKKVKKVLVDGREFFSSDLRIATKNLDAELIDKVQVYDDRENDPDHLVEDVRVEKIINLKFKKKLRKSTFGKLYAGGGTQGRYESGGFYNMFRDTLQISLLGMSNNLGNTGFDFRDLYSQGGLNRGGEIAFRGGGGINNGINSTTSGGVNINTDYGKKLKVNLAYYYTHGNTDFDGLNSRAQATKDTTFTTRTINARNVVTNRHNITASVKSQKEGMQWSYTPLFSFVGNQSVTNNTTNSFSDFIPQISKSVYGDNSSGNNLQFNHTFAYNHQVKKPGSSIDVQHNLSINPDNNDDYSKTDLTSYVSSLSPFSLNRYAFNRNKNISGNVAVAYRYPLSKKVTASIGVGQDYNQVISKGETYDFNPLTGLYDIYLAPQSTDLTRNVWKESTTPGITYAIKKNISLVAGATIQLQQVNNQFGRNITDVDRKYFDVLPSIKLSVGSYSTGSYYIGYAQSINLPNIGDLIPYTIVINPLFTVKGNPDLKQSRRHSLNAGYNIYKPASQTSISFNAGIGIDENSVFRERTLNIDGAETTTPINKSGRFTSNAGIYYSRPIKKSAGFQLSSSSNLYANTSRNFFEVNHQEGYQNLYNFSLNQGLSLNWKDMITMDPALSLSQSVSQYTGVQYSNVNNTTFSFESPYTINWPKRMDISGTYSYMYNPLVSPGFQKSTNLLNVSIARQFLKKDRAEIKLSCYDILNQAISTNRTIYENITNDTQSNIIRRYFMLTLRWKFNSTKVDENPLPKIPMMIRRL